MSDAFILSNKKKRENWRLKLFSSTRYQTVIDFHGTERNKCSSTHLVSFKTIGPKQTNSKLGQNVTGRIANSTQKMYRNNNPWYHLPNIQAKHSIGSDRRVRCNVERIGDFSARFESGHSLILHHLYRSGDGVFFFFAKQSVVSLPRRRQWQAPPPPASVCRE